MRAEVRELWAAALESDRFAQGRSRLTSFLRLPGGDVTTNCCLGVLCELAVEAGVPLRVRDVDVPGGVSYREYDGAQHFPPPAVLDWAGLDDQNPLVRVDDRDLTLGVVNDELQLSFAAIAQLVRDQL